MSISMKKRKLHEDEEDSRPTKIVSTSINNKQIIYILPDCIGPRRLEIMEKSVNKMGLTLSTRMTANVTHVLSELETKEDVLESKEFSKFKSWKGYILHAKWLAECVRCHSLVSETGFLLPSIPSHEKKADDVVPHEEIPLYPIPEFDLKAFNECIPERKAILDHQNKEIAAALDLLSEYWEICHQTKTDENRALAFARAAAAIKCLPFKATNSQQLKGIKGLGNGHALRVATQILESGYCPEVEEKRNDKKFLSLQIFCKVYGVGPSIAEKWYAQGLRTVEDVKKLDQHDIANNDMIAHGVAFYDDLNRPLLRAEAENTYKYITDLAKLILPSVVTSMNGGFRRGKSSGHDLDVLFSYPEREDGDYGLIAAVLDELNKKGLVVWSRATHTDGPRKVIEIISSPLSSGSTNEHLPTTMIIFKYPLDDRFDEFERRDFSGERNLGPFQLANLNRQWRAIRVDLVGSTNAQYPYAQVGWTGSKQYNRSLRQYAKDSLNYSLSSMGLHDNGQPFLVTIHRTAG
ncbi:DNA nucleotidylexotransferase-like isoform X1 [Daphnia pulex]|uniref:DNA nucleotidylexotransferase-like isoform X1 n=1 Tax=Daphnia pulex TaxID=6669 RepID=UPI001EDE9D6B|nr:DNA nucleotidylexotransferase-like isoform X1 [Daphnia pulex]